MRNPTMNDLFKAAALTEQILKAANTSEKANALIRKWNDKNLGHCPLATAANLEARNQVFNWGR